MWALLLLSKLVWHMSWSLDLIVYIIAYIASLPSHTHALQEVGSVLVSCYLRGYCSGSLLLSFVLKDIFCRLVTLRNMREEIMQNLKELAVHSVWCVHQLPSPQSLFTHAPVMCD